MPSTQQQAFGAAYSTPPTQQQEYVVTPDRLDPLPNRGNWSPGAYNSPATPGVFYVQGSRYPTTPVSLPVQYTSIPSVQYTSTPSATAQHGSEAVGAQDRQLSPTAAATAAAAAMHAAASRQLPLYQQSFRGHTVAPTRVTNDRPSRQTSQLSLAPNVASQTGLLLQPTIVDDGETASYQTGANKTHFIAGSLPGRDLVVESKNPEVLGAASPELESEIVENDGSDSSDWSPPAATRSRHPGQMINPFGLAS